MELTVEVILELRGQGLTWHAIGLLVAKENGGDAYNWQETARNKFRRYQTKRKSASGTHTSNLSEAKIKIEVAGLEDEESLLIQHGYDPKIWSVVDSSCTVRGDVSTTRIKVKPAEFLLDFDKLGKMVADSIKHIPYNRRHEGDITSERLAVLSLFDLHYGRQYKEKNHEETRAVLLDAVESIAQQLETHRPHRILLPLGQDFFNSDNPQKTTTRGTPQSTGMEWNDMYATGIALVIDVIERLARVAPVDIVYTRGNHDETLGYTMVVALGYRYANDPNINVDSSYEFRVYYKWLDTLIGIAHGDSDKDLFATMPTEARELWGETTYHYWLTGHFHHLEMIEKKGITLIKCPSLTFGDGWTEKSGFIGARASLVCTTYDYGGLREIYFAN